MAKFKVGDRVKCINAKPKNPNRKSPPLVLGREYIVYRIFICQHCGEESLDVGLITENMYGTNCSCQIPIDNTTAHWASEFRFEKAIEKVEYIAVATDIEIQEPTLN